MSNKRLFVIVLCKDVKKIYVQFCLHTLCFLLMSLLFRKMTFKQAYLRSTAHWELLSCLSAATVLLSSHCISELMIVFVTLLKINL